jgi:hypothetical protein
MTPTMLKMRNIRIDGIGCLIDQAEIFQFIVLPIT